MLVTEDMVAHMAPGSVIVDLASERGGNCELTRPGEEVVDTRRHDYRPDQPGQHACPYHASQMYARNVTAFLLHLVQDGKLQLNLKTKLFAARW